jgi:hypothetical protein
MTIADASSIRPTSRDRTTWTLIGVVITYALLNSVASWLGSERMNDALQTIASGALVFQPIIFAGWTALGAGSVLMRFAVAAPSLLLVFVAPTYVATLVRDVRKDEFVVAVLVGFAIYGVFLVIFWIMRRFTGSRIQSLSSALSGESARFTFSIKSLLTLMTLCALALGLVTTLQFQTSPRPGSLIFGPDFYIRVTVMVGAILSAAVLPTVAVPLAILYGRPSRRAATIAITIWAMVLLAAAVVASEGTDVTGSLEFVALAQAGATLLGALTAIALRWAGWRLIRLS